MGGGMRTIVIANEKGGSGKTTITASLASALRERGRFVTLGDLDPQGALGFLSPGVEPLQPRDVARFLNRHGADDYVLLDTPPYLGEAVRVAVKLADGVIIPSPPEFLALRGLSRFLGLVDVDKVIGLVVIGHRAHVKHHRLVLERLEQLGPRILAIIPYSVSAADPGLLGRDVLSYSPAKSRGVATAYRELASEVERWAKTD